MEDTMKCLIIVLATIFSCSSFAGIFTGSYKKDTIVPVNLQDEVAQAIYNRYPCLSNLLEVDSTERVDRVDQGVVDRYYTTVFTSLSTLDHPSHVYVTVDFAEYAFSNGKNTAILNLQTNYGDYICP